MTDPHNLARFVTAQDPVYHRVTAELRAGLKSSHWIWFIFPQLRGLGFSPMAHKFGVGSLEEAQEYLKHPILGDRLRECVALVNEVDGRSATQIFGTPDDLKFRSSLTLFAHAAPDEPLFRTAIQKYFGGIEDPLTLERLLPAH